MEKNNMKRDYVFGDLTDAQFNNAVRIVMESRAETSKELAELLDVHQVTLSRKLNGHGRFNPGERLLVADALGIDKDELIHIARTSPQLPSKRGRKSSVRVAVRRHKVARLLECGMKREQISKVLGMQDKMPTLDQDLRVVRSKDYDESWLSSNDQIMRELREFDEEHVPGEEASKNA
jgi:transcriptional regulator with XRE-family HTH domain